MTVNLFNEVKPGFSFHYIELASRVVEAVLDHEGFPYEAEVNVTLVDNPTIHAINKDTREIDRPTDVLSFPMLEYEEPAVFDFIEEDWDFLVNPDTDEVVLGDIVLSVDKVKSQAEEFGHSVRREYAFLICHSMLHLLGYDHMTEEEAKVMEQKQREVMDILKIYR